MSKPLSRVLLIGIVSLLALASIGYAQESKVWVAHVFGMSCPLCANNIEKQIKRDKDVKNVSIDLGTGEIKVEYKLDKTNVEKPIRKAIGNAGFTVKGVTPWKEKN